MGLGALQWPLLKFPIKSTLSPKKWKNMKKTCIKGGEKYKTRSNTASNNGESIMKKPFLGSWEGLKREKLLQILHFSQAIISQKSQF